MFQPRITRPLPALLAAAMLLLAVSSGAQDADPPSKPADAQPAAKQPSTEPKRQPPKLPPRQPGDPTKPGDAAEPKSQPAAPKQPAEPVEPAEPLTKEDARAVAMRSPVASSHQLLLIFGVEPSHYEMLIDNAPIDLSEGEALLKMLYAVRKFKATHIFQWIDPKPDLAQVVAQPSEHRGKIMKVWGRVTQVEVRKPLPEQVTRFELPKYYRCQMTTVGENPRKLEVYAHEVPQAWLKSSTWQPPGGWRASIEGFFLKLADDEKLVFVSQRMAWHSGGMLGKLAMDVGLFDKVEDRRDITGHEREAFYQMLYAVGAAGKNELARRTQILFDQTEFKTSHIRHWPDFFRTLIVAAEMPENTAEHQVWLRLSSDLQQQVKDSAPGSIPPKELQAQMVAELNAELDQKKSMLYHPQAWLGDFLALEGDRLIARAVKSLKPDERMQLNRKLIEVAFELDIVAGDGPIHVRDLRQPGVMARKLKANSTNPTPLPGKLIWNSLSNSLKQKIEDLGEDGSLDARATAQLAQELSKLLNRSTFFNNAAWQGHRLPDEAVALLRQAVDNLPFSSQKRLRRLLLEAAFPELIAPTTEYSVVPLFNHPEAQRGRLLALYGTARRAIRIPVDDPDIRTRFKIDHYYEMEVFTDDSQSNPVTFCVRKLPQGMPEGENIIEAVRIPAFFFKSWRYQSGVDKEKYPDKQKQIRLAPLLIGREPIWIRPELAHRAPNPWFGALAGVMFIAALSFVWLGVWGYSRSDDRFHNEQLARNYNLEPGLSLNEAGIEADDEVHFRNYKPPDEGSPEPKTPGDVEAKNDAADSDSNGKDDGTSQPEETAAKRDHAADSQDDSSQPKGD